VNPASEPSGQAPDLSEPPRKSVSLVRVLLIGTALAIPFAFWLQYAEMVQREGLFAVESALPLPAVTGLLILVCLHGILKLLRVDRWLPRAEILLIYAFLLITVPLASYGLAQQLLAHITGAHYYANPNNNFHRIIPHLPEWIGPTDPGHLKALYSKGAEAATYGLWVAPICKWMVFLLAFFCMCLCLGLLVERQWSVAERLRYPLTAPALELTASGPTRLLEKPLLRDPVMWIGVAWSAFYAGTSVLHALIPTFKPLYFAGAIGPIRFSYRPIVLGVAYLAPTNLSLSIWFFELVKGGQKMLGEALGLSSVRGTTLPTTLARFPYSHEQALGAFIFIALMSVWMARRHLLRTLKSIWGNAKDDDAGQTRAALIGLLVSGSVIVVWLLWAGFIGGAVVCFLILAFFIAVTHARIRAEAGPPLIWNAPYRPDILLVSMVGSAHFSSASLAQLGLLGFMSNGYFPLLMATQLDTLKIARETRVRRRDVAILLVAAVIVGTVAGVWSLLYYWYSEGAENLLSWPLRSAQRSYAAAVAHMKYSSGTDLYAACATVAGFVFTGLLALARRVFWFWPLHPLGYAISQTATTHMWAMFLVAWLVKFNVIRYGGLKAYRLTVPFFFGLIFGQIGMLIVSNILNYFYNLGIYVSAF